MELSFDGSLTKKDFISAVKLANRSIAKKSLLRVDPWIPSLILGALLFVGGPYAFLFGPDHNLYIMAGPMILGMLVITTTVSGMPGNVWNSKPEVRSRMQGKVTEKGLVFIHPNGQLTMDWEGYKGYGEYRDVVDLFNEGGTATIFARTFFKTDQEWMDFKEMVGNRLPITHDVSYRKIKLGVRHYVILVILLINLIVIFRYGIPDR